MISAPKDTISRVGSRVMLDCSVVGMSTDDVIIWRYSSDGEQFHRLFVSHSAESGSPLLFDRDRYEIIDQYNLVIKSATLGDSGIYVCEIVNLRNYTAELTVLSESCLLLSFC